MYSSGDIVINVYGLKWSRIKLLFFQLFYLFANVYPDESVLNQEMCTHPPEVVVSDQLQVLYHVAATALLYQLVFLDIHVLEETLKTPATSIVMEVKC